MLPQSIYFSRRDMLLGVVAIAPAIAIPAAVDAVGTGAALTPEMFGAKGDGVSNDTAALARLAAAVNSAGGGLVTFAAGKTYIVGGQSLSQNPKSRYLFEPLDVLVFKSCRGSLTIRGNGAKLMCDPGLRFGTFDRSGSPTHNPMPFTGRGQAASPYRYMIQVEDCRGPIEISDFELDGNLSALIIGGKFGNKGWQLAGSGLGLFNNRGSERIRNIHTHHHPKDGLYIHGLAGSVAGPSRQLTGIQSEYNGRQACSITSGNGYEFHNCRFNHTGRAGLSSAPGAGVDIEAHRDTTNRNFRFVDCEFLNNRGVGMVADKGDSEGASFDRCKFVGTTSWAAWPKKPRFRFNNCLFVGAIVHAFGDPDPNRACQFHECQFLDDPSFSPTGNLLPDRKSRGICANLPRSENALFNRCEFRMTRDGVLPWSTTKVIYSDCEMSQKSPRQAQTRGTWMGTNRLIGNIRLGRSIIRGTVILNGRTIPRTMPK